MKKYLTIEYEGKKYHANYVEYAGKTVNGERVAAGRVEDENGREWWMTWEAGRDMTLWLDIGEELCAIPAKDRTDDEDYDLEVYVQNYKGMCRGCMTRYDGLVLTPYKPLAVDAIDHKFDLDISESYFERSIPETD